MKKINVKTKDEARSVAIEFSNWQSTKVLSYSELFKWSIYFKDLAIKFDLTEEFLENAII